MTDINKDTRLFYCDENGEGKEEMGTFFGIHLSLKHVITEDLMNEIPCRLPDEDWPIVEKHGNIFKATCKDGRVQFYRREFIDGTRCLVYNK